MDKARARGPVDLKPAAVTDASPPSGGADQLFIDAQTASRDFAFDSATVAVFDDMVSRSVPYYEEIQRMVCEMAADFAVPGTNLYDLGCATGTSLLVLDPHVPADVRFVGVDNSKDMLDRARERLAAHRPERRVDFVDVDLNDTVSVENCSVCLMVLTLQFVRPLQRERLMRRICEGMTDNGCLLLVEKLLSPYSLLNRQFIRYYYDLKRRRGYSEDEITRKREALENVLIPYRYEENTELLLRAGFSQVDEFFRWYNFCGIVAIK